LAGIFREAVLVLESIVNLRDVAWEAGMELNANRTPASRDRKQIDDLRRIMRRSSHNTQSSQVMKCYDSVMPGHNSIAKDNEPTDVHARFYGGVRGNPTQGEQYRRPVLMKSQIF
jgi:hypothetical protein